MKILVTGASGFLGKNLIRELSKEHSIRCLVRKKTSKKDISFLRKHNTELIYGDITNIVSIKDVTKNIDIIFHLASKLMGKSYNKNIYNKVNVEGTSNLINDSKKSNVKKFIFISTAGVYGSVIKANENSPISPTNIYEKTKAKAEKMVINSSLDYIILRPGIIFGPEDKRIIKMFKIANKGVFPLIGKGDNILQLLFVKDFVLIVVNILKLKLKNQIINVAGNEEISLKDFVIKINRKVKLLHLPKNLFYYISRINDFLERKVKISLILNSNRFDFFTQSRTYNISKLKRLINPKFTKTDIAVKETNDWLKNNELS